MNYSRIALAALGATVAYFVLGGILLPACSDSEAAGTSGSGGTTGSGSGSTSGSTSGEGGAGGSAMSGSGGSGGAIASGSGGAGGSAMSGAGGGSDVSALSDSFDGAALAAEWQILNPGAVTVNVTGGALELTLTKKALWYQASQGVLVYKNVTGDFKATSRVHARRMSAPGLPPAGPVELGGLMARSPAGPPENYVFIVVGADENDISVETKSTVNSQSVYVGPAWPSTSAELRVCRVGSDFVLLKRVIGDSTWTQAEKFARPDLPAALQVGPNIYSLNQPDLTVAFDEVTFAPVASLADCASD